MPMMRLITTPANAITTAVCTPVDISRFIFVIIARTTSFSVALSTQVEYNANILISCIFGCRLTDNIRSNSLRFAWHLLLERSSTIVIGSYLFLDREEWERFIALWMST